MDICTETLIHQLWVHVSMCPLSYHLRLSQIPSQVEGPHRCGCALDARARAGADFGLGAGGAHALPRDAAAGAPRSAWARPTARAALCPRSVSPPSPSCASWRSCSRRPCSRGSSGCGPAKRPPFPTRQPPRPQAANPLSLRAPSRQNPQAHRR